MTDYEILSKAIIKSNIRKYNYPCSVTKTREYYTLIFSFEFAKAFWGEQQKNCCSACNGDGVDHCRQGYQCYYCNGLGYHLNQNSGWKYHLQQMVLKEEPLKYLEKFL